MTKLAPKPTPIDTLTQQERTADHGAKIGQVRQASTVTDYVFRGARIDGLRQRPDGRFYAGDQPYKMFAKEPARMGR